MSSEVVVSARGGEESPPPTETKKTVKATGAELFAAESSGVLFLHNFQQTVSRLSDSPKAVQGE